MFLGIEIGGTKLQLGVGAGNGEPIVAIERLAVVRSRGGGGIREQIEQVGRALIDKHEITAVGIAFGGPVDAAAGRTIASHQIEGWDNFPLADWCRRTLKRPTAMASGC